MDQWSRLDDELDHLYYRRWSRGELSAAELALYAGRYRHAVVAVARAADSTAAESFELAAHVSLRVLRANRTLLDSVERRCAD